MPQPFLRCRRKLVAEHPQLGHSRRVIVVQRVRVRWDAASRGSTHANRRRGLPEVFPLPEQAPTEEFVLHEVLLDQANRYTPSSCSPVGMEAVRSAGLWLEIIAGRLAVDRLPAGKAYPRTHFQQRLFTLEPGEAGRHRGNFRCCFTSCACNPSWYYEQWTTHIAFSRQWQADMFAHHTPSYDIDDRVHLYGGRARRSGKSHTAAA